ncbi:hypothetical protein [Actinoplanes solisilvae]|uniref:hypothetical protein n=1 Tax=Actinoplanes solisilvae TaxID=2486853 RepID=UPI000FDC3C4D|nr:hypothetical protein [Actinoplanes solisilvae]
MHREDGRASLGALAACGGALALAAWAAFWWLAVPRHDICSLTFPAPAGCSSARVPVAAVWSAVIASSYVVLLFFAARRHGAWVVGLLGLVIGAVWGFYSVLYA